MTGIELDVTNPNHVEKLKSDFDSMGIQLDALVNNAGVIFDSPDGGWCEQPNGLDVELEVIERTINTNALSVLR